MQPTGIICAVLDCDADSIEQWNRWYDLEHVPPNVSMQGVMLGRRYVAPPELHELRTADAASGFGNQHGTFVTIYTLCEPPLKTVGRMSTLREKLYAENRMNFPPEKKVVRDGGALVLVSGVSSKELALPVEDIPFLGHTAVILVQRRASDAVAEWYRTEWSSKVVEVDGVHGVMSLRYEGKTGEELDIVFMEGDAVALTKAVRAAAPHHADATIVADAPFLLIDPLRYPWADAIRASSLPQTVGE
jgi:hypothetical protein